MKNTKRSMLVSGLCLLLTAVMLMGSTFAWFTDSVTNEGNTIQSGELEVGFQYKDLDDTAAVYAPVAEKSDELFNYAKWEPGYSYGYDFKVSNNGSLALKWQLYFTNIKSVDNKEDSDFNIADVLDVYITAEDAKDLSNATYVGTLSEVVSKGGFVLGDVLNTQGSSKAFSVVVKMQEKAGNDYQNCTVSFDVELRATQTAYEEDGFGNTHYDTNAGGDPDNQDWDYVISGKQTAEKVAGTALVMNDVDGAQVTLPEGMPAGNYTLSIEPTTVPAGVKPGDKTAVAYEINLEGLKEGNNTPIKVTLYIGKYLNNVVLYHNSQKVEGAEYTAETGYITFETKSFSPFTAVYDVPVVIDSNEALVNAILNQADGQTWLFTKAGTYDAKPADADGYTVAEKINNTTGPFVFPIYADNITITKAEGVGEVVLTSSAHVNTGNWNYQNFITVSGNNVVLDGVDLLCNRNDYYYDTNNFNKAVELIDGAVNFAIKNCEIKALEGETGKFSGSIYINVANPENVVIENVTMYAWISGGAVANSGNVHITNVVQDYRDSAAADKEYYGPGLVGNDTAYDINGLTILANEASCQYYGLVQVLNGDMKSGTTYIFDEGTYTLNGVQGGTTGLSKAGITLNKAISIVGAENGGTVIDIDGAANVSQMAFTMAGGSEGTVFQNLTFDMDFNGRDSAAIYFNDSYDNTDSSKTTEIENVKFVGLESKKSETQNIAVLSASPDGGYVVIRDCFFQYMKYAMYFNEMDNLVIENNTFDNTLYGGIIVAADNANRQCNNIIIRDNVMTNISTSDLDYVPEYDSGIAIGDNATNVTIEGNDIQMMHDKGAIYKGFESEA